MSYEPDGAYDIYVATVRKARVTHRCSACWLTINPGERYMEVRLAWEGRAETVKRCGRCEAIHRHLVTEHAPEYWPDERLNCGEDYEYEWGVPPPLQLQAAIFATSDEASALLEAKP